jgi:broad specificity polyphosphatase/5'/3'-nucleotidase SurE
MILKTSPEKKTKPLILVTNDDGILAPGIRALIAVMSEIGTVVVVAATRVTEKGRRGKVSVVAAELELEHELERRTPWQIC